MSLLFPPLPDDAPPPFPAVTDRNIAHWMDEGSALLDSTAKGAGVSPTNLDAVGIRKLVHLIVDGGVGHLRALTGLLVSGAIKLGGWFKSFLGDLVPRHFAAAKAALGVNLNVNSAGLVGQVNQQAGFLNRFKEAIADAEQLLNGTAVARAAQYSVAVWGMAQNLWRGRMILLGYREERCVLGVADHCEGCLARAFRRWVAIGSLPPIGATQCGPMCRCHFEFR